MSILPAAESKSIIDSSAGLEVGSVDDLLERIAATLNPGQLSAFEVERLSAIAASQGGAPASIPEIGISAGYGSGKTYCAHAVAVKMAALNQGFVGCVMEPTSDMVRRIWAPKFEDFLDSFGIPYTPRVAPYVSHTLHFPGGDSTILGLSFENYQRIVGDDWAFAIIDEVDTAKASIAQRAYDKILGRIRVGNFNQLHCYSTPEGFGFHYQTFGTDAAREGKRRALLRMKTADNAHNLRPGFVDDLLSRYTQEQCRAYLEGIYQNLATGTVYDRFDRAKHVADVDDDPEEPLRIGIDFNVGNTNAALAIRSGNALHFIDEISQAHDTDALAQEICARYPGRTLYGYPDASGGNRSTNATKTDLEILASYGISNQSPKANPRVADRVSAFQGALENGKGEIRIQINPRCKRLIECLELQAYNERQEPDKESGHDHMNDAAGYLVWRELNPLHRRAGRGTGIRLY
jgi:phage terminase large subunit-like protein